MHCHLNCSFMNIPNNMYRPIVMYRAYYMLYMYCTYNLHYWINMTPHNPWPDYVMAIQLTFEIPLNWWYSTPYPVIVDSNLFNMSALSQTMFCSPLGGLTQIHGTITSHGDQHLIGALQILSVVCYDHICPFWVQFQYSDKSNVACYDIGFIHCLLAKGLNKDLWFLYNVKGGQDHI